MAACVPCRPVLFPWCKEFRILLRDWHPDKNPEKKAVTWHPKQSRIDRLPGHGDSCFPVPPEGEELTQPQVR